jgi:hypothetical protein
MTAYSSGANALDSQVFDEWPPELRALFDGTALAEKVGFTASLVTADANGHLRTSLLSTGELYAPDVDALCFSLWPTARAVRALREQAADGKGGIARARAALTFVHGAAFYQVQLKNVEPLPSDGERACFYASIDVGEMQRVAYAHLTSGIAFELQGQSSEAVLGRWQRQVDRLRLAAQSRRAAQWASGA